MLINRLISQKENDEKCAPQANWNGGLHPDIRRRSTTGVSAGGIPSRETCYRTQARGYGRLPSNSLGKFYGLKAAPRQNAENELNFTLTTKDGEESLELMEVAVLGKESYESAPLSYNHGELADAICAGIAKKSAKY